MQASLLTDFIKCNVHSIHKIPDAIHNLPLNLCVAFQFSSSIKDHTTLIPMVLFCFTFGK